VQRGDLAHAQQRAGGVGGRGHHQAAGVGGPCGVDLGCSGLVAGGGIHRQRPCHALEAADQVAVGRIAGVGQQPGVAGVGGRGQRQHQRARGARGDDDALGGDVGPYAVLVEARDRLAQRGQAERGGVMHVAAGDEALRGGHDGLRRGKVGLADLHVDDVPPLRLELARAAQQFHDVEGLDVVEAA